MSFKEFYLIFDAIWHNFVIAQFEGNLETFKIVDNDFKMLWSTWFHIVPFLKPFYSVNCIMINRKHGEIV